MLIQPMINQLIFDFNSKCRCSANNAINFGSSPRVWGKDGMPSRVPLGSPDHPHRCGEKLTYCIDAHNKNKYIVHKQIIKEHRNQ